MASCDVDWTGGARGWIVAGCALAVASTSNKPRSGGRKNLCKAGKAVVILNFILCGSSIQFVSKTFSLPVFQRVLQRVSERAHGNARGEQFGYVQNAIGAWHTVSLAVEFRVISPKLETSRWLKDLLHDFHNLPRREAARIGYVVDAIRRTSFPKVEASADKIFRV